MNAGQDLNYLAETHFIRYTLSKLHLVWNVQIKRLLICYNGWCKAYGWTACHYKHRVMKWCAHTTTWFTLLASNYWINYKWASPGRKKRLTLQWEICVSVYLTKIFLWLTCWTILVYAVYKKQKYKLWHSMDKRAKLDLRLTKDWETLMLSVKNWFFGWNFQMIKQPLENFLRCKP